MHEMKNGGVICWKDHSFSGENRVALSKSLAIELRRHKQKKVGITFFNFIFWLLEFERNIIRKRQAEGIARAKYRGVYSSRAKKINDRKIIELKQKGYGASEIASEMGITRTSV